MTYVNFQTGFQADAVFGCARNKLFDKKTIQIETAESAGNSMTWGKFQTAFGHVLDSLKTCLDKQTWAYRALSVSVGGWNFNAVGVQGHEGLRT